MTTWSTRAHWPKREPGPRPSLDQITDALGGFSSAADGTEGDFDITREDAIAYATAAAEAFGVNQEKLEVTFDPKLAAKAAKEAAKKKAKDA